MPVSPETLKRLQSQPALVRNICILAHVDHGKTTLSDSLLASNGIISQNMAGKLRYLDSRPDEQMRGITMESSAISLYFRIASRPTESQSTDQKQPQPPAPKGPVGRRPSPNVKEYLINLIDSPGHIDFSSEVSTASRLCDGALILVDAVEGVLSQTVTVIRQAWVEKLKPILVINKIDRLITELRLTPMEAYTHLTRVIEQVNAIMGSFFAGDRMEQDMLWRERQELRQANNTGDDEDDIYVEQSDDNLYFSPELNNIIFSSAIDGWGFNISQFAAIYERKLGMKREKLEKVLWGDYFFDPKSKKVVSGSSSAAKALKGTPKPLFVQLVLDNIWKIYESSVIERDPDQSAKIVAALGLDKIPPATIKAKDGKPLLSAIFNQWIPLSVSVLLTVIDKLPAPTTAQQARIPPILETVVGGSKSELDPKVRDAMVACDMDGPVVSYISKVIAVPEDELVRKKTEQEQQEANKSAPMSSIQERVRRARELSASLQKQNSDSGMVAAGGKGYSQEEEEDVDDLDAYFKKLKAEAAPEVKEKLIGFARVFSGTLKVGQELYLLHPKYDPVTPEMHREKIVISDLFLLMGRDLVSLKEVPAGNIVGIGGLDGKILKNGTLVSLEHGGPNLASITNLGAPIVRVAVEPVDPTKLDQLEKGLKLLNLSDPMVQVSVAENGEHILMTAGELHLERCLKDLKERFAKVDIHASEPIIPYRETIVAYKGAEQQKAMQMQRQKNKDDEEEEIDRDNQGVVEIELDPIYVRLRVEPLPKLVTQFLNENQTKIETLVSRRRRHKSDEESYTTEAVTGEEAKQWESFEQEFDAVVSESFKKMKEKNVREGLRKVLKLANVMAFGPKRTGSNILLDGTPDSGLGHKAFAKQYRNTTFAYGESLMTGFQLATQHGPLAGEPLEGVVVTIELAESKVSEQETGGQSGFKSNVSGRLISATREHVQQGFLDWSPRLLLAMYQCEIQATTEVLGKVYGVITKRRGKILSEEMREGTPFFLIHASIPVVEAFGFSEEIRKRTSGAANPQLVFSGFQMAVDEDPFWVPLTEEELEELGDTADRENIAKMYMDNVRRRKGLAVSEKVVANAEKQRTLKH